jgi:predicted DNA-binding transcriptional regulator YafY
MKSVEVLEEEADRPVKGSFNIVEYTKRTFAMYSGVTVMAFLSFDASLVSVVLDHFGNSTRLKDSGDGRFTIETAVSASPTFLAWMFQLGEKAEILAPESLRDAMRDMIAVGARLYGV